MIQLVSAYLLKQSGHIQDNDPTKRKTKRTTKRKITEMFSMYNALAYKHMGVIVPTGGRWLMSHTLQEDYAAGRKFYESNRDYWAARYTTYTNDDGEESIVELSNNYGWILQGTSALYFSACDGNRVDCTSGTIMNPNAVELRIGYDWDAVGHNYNTGDDTHSSGTGTERVSDFAMSYGTRELVNPNRTYTYSVYAVPFSINLPIFSSVEDFQRYKTAVQAYENNPTEENLLGIEDALDYSLNPD